MDKIGKPRKNLVSIVIPAYKQEKTIKKDLKRIKSVLDQLRYAYEMIVVIDGLMDKTAIEARKIHSKKITVFSYKENHGKGYAVQYGMAQAKGDIVAFIDAGMDLNPNGISMLLEHFEWYNADIVVGSKLHPVSKVYYPLPRKVLSFIYRFIVRLMFGLTIRDTQVGMKFFRRKVIEDVLPRLLVKKYAFDIEILAVAYNLGYKRIYEAPIELDFTNVSSSITSQNFWIIASRMMWDTLAVFYRLKILGYYGSKNKKMWQSRLTMRLKKKKK